MSIAITISTATISRILVCEIALTQFVVRREIRQGGGGSACGPSNKNVNVAAREASPGGPQRQRVRLTKVSVCPPASLSHRSVPRYSEDPCEPFLIAENRLCPVFR